MPIVLGIVAVAILVGGGLFLLSSDDITETNTADSEEAARIDSQESPEMNSEMEDGDEATVDVETEAEAEIETSALETDIDLDSETTVSAQTYKASASYQTPNRVSHEVTVNLTVAADGTITDSDVVYDDGAGYSNGHQERFDQAYAAQVEGKTVSEVNLSRVGGASLTTEAFNEAIAKIEAQQA